MIREKIDEVVGQPAIRDESWDPELNLLVFEENAQVVKVIGFSGLLGAGDTTWPADVRVEPWNGLVRLTVP